MRSISALLLLTATLAIVRASDDATKFAPFGTAVGDLKVALGDDNSASGYGFTFPFYGSVPTTVYVNNNGIISFNSQISAYTPVGMSQANFPAIAPFWGDVDTRSCGGVYYRATTDAALLALWSSQVPSAGFAGVRMMIVTYDHVGYYLTHCNKLNTFQIIMITDGGNSWVFNNYGDLQWTTGDASGGSNGAGGVPASIGFSAGDGVRFVQTPESLTAAVLNTRNFVTLVSGVSVVIAPPPAQTCGNGVLEGTEQCDGTACCTGSCTFSTAAFVCRASAGPCDVAETCTGSSASCPADSFVSSATTCRASAGVCDVAETCTGSAAACPADSFAAPSITCRSPSGVCDVAEACSGTSASCPSDTFLGAETTCRVSSGVCDVAETCSGSSSSCPADSFLGAQTTCRSASGDCDVAETCSGSAASCPADSFLGTETTCRASAGDCDAAETCSGSAASCPADSFAASGTTCRVSAGDCDVAETCTGSSITCPADAYATRSRVCRPAANSCDISESCSGTSITCPADALSQTTACFCARQNLGNGDMGYFCNANGGFYQCLGGVFASQSRSQNCALGTHCGCGFGEECSCHQAKSPCVRTVDVQVC